MYNVKFGGKKGETIHLIESPDMVAIRTKGDQELKDVQVTRESRALINETTEVVKFPEAGITVRRVAQETDGLESTLSRRDETRAALKLEDNIRFAGRVLQNAKSGDVMLYTENFFVKFNDKVSEADCQGILAKYQLTIKSKLSFATNAYFACASEGTGLKVFEIAEQLLAENQVEYCHPELVQERRFKTIHPLQWHLAKTKIAGRAVDAHVNIEQAWKITKGKGITIAVIDDGIDVDHPEFKDRIVFPFDATEGLDDPRPKKTEDKHGTSCAGMACASGLSNGASGTAPEAALMPIRLRSGLGSMAEANAFAWAADKGADVISCSWGPSDGDWWNPEDPTHTTDSPLPDSTRLAMEYALSKGRKGKGCVILFAAGNGNESIKYDGYASFPGVIAVGACNDTGIRSVYSDYGEALWACFPSNDFAHKPFKRAEPISTGLRTTDRQKSEGYGEGDYTDRFGGTSGACPGMAGIVGLMLAVNPALTPAGVKDLIRLSCNPIDTKEGAYDENGHSVWYGYGRIDAGKAVHIADADQSGPAVSGVVRFSKIGERTLLPGCMTGSFQPAHKVLGLKLGLAHVGPGVALRYKVNVPGLGVVESVEPGQMIGVKKASQRIIGLALQLEGPSSSKYDIEYTAKLKGQSAPMVARNGDFCGSSGKTGKTVEGILIKIRKKGA